ncbi:MAG TPA: hypothetical protein VFI25_19660 [Planctomycetota bacterium]|jgi:hypothetical protein|nr:hypothetical protein [Planctomycetota bacterium]
MALPTPDQYNEAVQAPQLAFLDPVLRSGDVERNALGLPLALGGSFAITYRVRSRGKKSYAVRCFHKSTADLAARYDLIHRALQKVRLPYFVEFEYQHQGIRVRGSPYPIVKMEWAEGETLGPAVESCYRDAGRLRALQRGFDKLETALRAAGLGHGDLQNGNVIVERRGLRLVDYDGMFVPGMTRGNGVEIGHRHFQHPGRTSRLFGPEIDRFSFILLDLTFDALRLRPQLYEKFGSGENLLFCGDDFTDPDSSPLFHELARLGNAGVRKRVEHFARICVGSVEEVPTLHEYRTGIKIPAKRAPAAARQTGGAVYASSLPVVDAAVWERTPARDGDRIELIGQVLDVRLRGRLRRHASLTLLLGESFGDAVRVRMGPEAVERLAREGSPEREWEGRWVSVTGLMGGSPRRRQRHRWWRRSGAAIAVDQPTQVLEIDREEARWRLGRGPKPPPSVGGARDRKSSNRKILQALKAAAASAPATPAPAPLPWANAPTASPVLKVRNQALLAKIHAGSPPPPPVTASAASSANPAPAAATASPPPGPASVSPPPPSKASTVPPGAPTAQRWGRPHWIAVGGALFGLLALDLLLRACSR